MMKGAYQMFPLGLRLSHLALVRNLEKFSRVSDGADMLTAPRDGQHEPLSRQRVADYVRWYADFLDVHHHGEDAHVFPAIRKSSPGRSTDIAHLERWQKEHADIYALGRTLRETAARLHDSESALPALRSCSAELQALLAPHLAEEEAVLTPEHLAELIPEKELERAQLEIPKSQGASALQSAQFLVHSLEPAEQRELLGETPWLFRKVLLDWFGKPRVWRYGPLMQSAAVDL
jgi:hemerythrin-like domain-containing protein